MEEKLKYETMWSFDDYRIYAPGENIADTFIQQANLSYGTKVIDYGAGTGRGALKIAKSTGAYVYMFDFAHNCLDTEVIAFIPELLTFTQHDLIQPLPISAAYGYCTDVMEHIPPLQIDLVLSNILSSSKHTFFQISTVFDTCGALIGEQLHLSIHPYEWWRSKLIQFNATITWFDKTDKECVFYVSN